jgi:ATP-binding cassette subfamily F protein 3
VLENIDFSLIPGERIGLLGLNGAGKTTFIKLLAGELAAFSGEVTRARVLQIGYFAQHQVEQLDLEANAILTMQRLDAKLSEREIRSYLGGFNFRGEKVLQPITTFSGGQKARLVLAMLIWQRPNLLLLDEPTNHLDLEMRLALNQALQGFEGSVILVSHDRHLLRSVCDDLWLVDSGRVQAFDGDLDDYPAWLARRKATPAGLAMSDAKPIDRRQHKAQLNRLKKLEREMMALTADCNSLEQQLGDQSIYDAANRDKLETSLAAQARNSERLVQVEEEWLSLSEAIEQQAS